MSQPIRGPSLQFAGGAGTVTGSKYVLRAAGRRVLLECGLFQGLKALRLRNWADPPFSPSEMEAVVLSHAHIDHSGYLPLLVRRGFRGRVHCTGATADLLRVLLLDSAHLQEEEADSANRHGYSKHDPALPLYTTEDVERALGLVERHAAGRPFCVVDGVRAELRHAGHILGSALVTLEIGKEQALVRLGFSGDLGRWDRPILRDPEKLSEVDVLLVESTYGDRVHGVDPDAELAAVVCAAAGRGGALIVPAFAVGRSQELLWRLRALEEARRIPQLPIFLDSPMAIDVTDIYARHAEEHDAETRAMFDAKHSPFACRQLTLVRTVAQSKALNERTGPMIIIAGSGMATGGRVLHHLEARLPDERSTVLLVGYQAAGTRGRSLQEGARTLRMHGRDVSVRARVATLDGLSAHADRNEILRWLASFSRPPRRTFVVHGEPHAAESLSKAIRERLGWTADVAIDGASVPLV
jgi:metallo-beta-lactamase family protein